MTDINCDLCGKVDEMLSRVLIEGVELNVCSVCSKFGKVIAPVKRYSPKEQHKQLQKQAQTREKAEKMELLVENYSDIIKKSRESMGLAQKDFANRINEKESIIHKIETGAFEPSLSLVKKLEKALGIKLIEEHEEKHESFKRKQEEGFTLGDFIRIKK